jgi:hypothetical protein
MARLVLRGFLGGEFADVFREIRVLAHEQVGELRAVIRAAAPHAHEILPRLPKAGLLFVYGLLVNKDVSAFDITSKPPGTIEWE